MISACDADAVAAAIERLFAEHEVASLRLPSGWFGRPYDNWHQLTDVTNEDDLVLVRLDLDQVLRLHVLGVAVQGRSLQIAVRGGTWAWTSYGGDDRHQEQVGAGTVEFHAPFAR